VIERFSQSTLQILRLLAEDAHLETKRSYEGTRVGASGAKLSEAERNERRLGSPSTSRVEKGATRAGLRIGVCWAGFEKIVRSLNECKKSARLEGCLRVPRRTYSRKNSWIGSSVRMRVSQSKRTQFESFNAYH
jgi:hypothetical protein